MYSSILTPLFCWDHNLFWNVFASPPRLESVRHLLHSLILLEFSDALKKSKFNFLKKLCNHKSVRHSETDLKSVLTKLKKSVDHPQTWHNRFSFFWYKLSKLLFSKVELFEAITLKSFIKTWHLICRMVYNFQKSF